MRPQGNRVFWTTMAREVLIRPKESHKNSLHLIVGEKQFRVNKTTGESLGAGTKENEISSPINHKCLEIKNYIIL